MLVAYPLPDKGILIFGKAWEWTVYCVIGVWRCLSYDKPNIVPRYFFDLTAQGTGLSAHNTRVK